MKPPRDPYRENATDPDDHFIVTDAERAGTWLIEAVQTFRDAYRALGVNDDDTYDFLLDLVHGSWTDPVA
jgi:hypothetical protein